jgi:hypothetical protein
MTKYSIIAFEVILYTLRVPFTLYDNVLDCGIGLDGTYNINKPFDRYGGGKSGIVLIRQPSLAYSPYISLTVSDIALAGIAINATASTAGTAAISNNTLRRLIFFI